MLGQFTGLVAQSVTYPFEVVRRRMQTEGIISREVGSISVLHSSNAQSPTNRSASLGSSAIFKEELTMVNCARDIVSKQGVSNLLLSKNICDSHNFTCICTFRRLWDFLKDFLLTILKGRLPSGK